MKVTADKITLVSIGKIRPYENNPRSNDSAVGKVAESITLFGFKSPVILDANHVIICGHTRWKAAKKLGMGKVPCIIAADLTPEQARAYRLVDNKTADLSRWDWDKLAKELGELKDGFPELDMSSFGFVTGDAEADMRAAFDEMLAGSDIAPPSSVRQVSVNFQDEADRADFIRLVGRHSDRDLDGETASFWFRLREGGEQA